MYSIHALGDSIHYDIKAMNIANLLGLALCKLESVALHSLFLISARLEVGREREREREPLPPSDLPSPMNLPQSSTALTSFIFKETETF